MSWRSGVALGGLAAALLTAVAATPTSRGDASPKPRREVAKLLERAEDLFLASAGKLTITQARAAWRAAQAEGDTAGEVAALSVLAAGLESLGERAAAEETFTQAVSLAQKTGEPLPQAFVLLYRSRGHWQRADYARALATAERALALAEQAGDRAMQAEALLALGRVEVKRGAYDAAVGRFSRALILADLTGDRRREAWAQESLAYADLDRRLFATALEHSAAALSIHQQLGSVAGQARVLEHLAVLHLFQGNGEDALAVAGRSLALAEGPGGNPASAALARQARAGALRRLGRYDEARGELERALALRRELGDPREEAWLLARLGSLAGELEQPAEALARYREALALWTRLEEWRPAALYLIEAARASERLDKMGAARDLYRAAIELAERIDLPYRSVALGGLARLEARAGERPAALLDGRRAVEAAHATGNLAMIWGALYDLAEVELAFGLQLEALEHLRAALVAIEKLRAESVPSDRAKRAESAERQRVFTRTVGLLYDLGLTAEALAVAERSRARASLDLFASAGARDAEAIAAELNRSGAEAVPSPRSAPVPAVPLLIGEVRSRGLTAIEYFVGEGRLFAWVIAADGDLHAVAVPLAAGELESWVRAARQELGTAGALRAAPALAAGRGAATSGDGSEPEAALDALYRLLIEPLAQWLPSEPGLTVAIVPHDRLFLLSFAALRDGAGRYFVERHALSYSPSLALLAWTGRPRRGATPRAPALVVGNPSMPMLPGATQRLVSLPGAELEARAVASELGGETVVLVGTAAGEAEVRRRAAGASLVHLATHSQLDEEEPLASLVALAPGVAPAVGDGRWTVAEIQEETLAADLVTLSACDTGLGRVSSDGVLGLSRAFLVAGARSVLVSLWRVADVTTRFQMTRFYAALAANGGDRAAALRQAQLETLAALRAGTLVAPSGRSIPDSPAYWAPFVLVGEPR
jgi:CHAT domain-containing protein/tetratricopeptide (TPR) repeat protein